MTYPKGCTESLLLSPLIFSWTLLIRAFEQNEKKNLKHVPTVQQNNGVMRLRHAGSPVLMATRNLGLFNNQKPGELSW